MNIALSKLEDDVSFEKNLTIFLNVRVRKNP